MFRCLDTGLDNSQQCLKKKKDMVRIHDNKQYSIDNEIQYSMKKDTDEIKIR